MRGFGEDSFDFHQLNGVGGQFRLDHSADPKVLLFGRELDGGPLAQQQFFGVDGFMDCGNRVFQGNW